jgi:hypothetical protein
MRIHLVPQDVRLGGYDIEGSNTRFREVYICKFPDGSVGGWTGRTLHRCLARGFDTAEAAAAYALELSPNYPATIVQN